MYNFLRTFFEPKKSLYFKIFDIEGIILRIKNLKKKIITYLWKHKYMLFKYIFFAYHRANNNWSNGIRLFYNKKYRKRCKKKSAWLKKNNLVGGKLQYET